MPVHLIMIPWPACMLALFATVQSDIIRGIELATPILLVTALLVIVYLLCDIRRYVKVRAEKH